MRAGDNLIPVVSNRAPDMRLPVAVLLVAVAAVLAGCASPSESGSSSQQGSTPSSSTPASSTPAGSTPAGSTPATPTPSGEAAFLLMGPLILDGTGNATQKLHEDERASTHYELSLTPGAGRDATALAALVVNDRVVDVQTVHLQPGETKKFDAPLSLANVTAIKVQVKVGSAVGVANATVAKWPRANEKLTLGSSSATLTQLASDASGVHTTVYLWVPADGSVTSASIALLCGAPLSATAQAEQNAMLDPGNATAEVMDFPACPSGQAYGLRVSLVDTDGTHVGRILFS